jgi:hypothetical protein
MPPALFVEHEAFPLRCAVAEYGGGHREIVSARKRGIEGGTERLRADAGGDEDDWALIRIRLTP